MTPRVIDILKQYSSQPIKRFFRLDGIAEHSPERIEYALQVLGERYELRAEGDADQPVSILIHENASRDDVVALLRHAADCLEESWYAVTVPEFLEQIEQKQWDDHLAEMEADGRVLHAETASDIDEFLKRMSDKLNSRAESDEDRARRMGWATDDDDFPHGTVDDIPF